MKLNKKEENALDKLNQISGRFSKKQLTRLEACYIRNFIMKQAKEITEKDESIEIQQEEIENSIPREKIKKLLDKYEHMEANEDTAGMLWAELRKIYKKEE